MKRVAIVQSNYVPWKGYFDLIASVDEFILFDEMQYTRRDWRNRNKIKTPDGAKWLSVPVKVKGKYTQKISETEIDDSNWQQAHWNNLQQNYNQAKYFSEIAVWLKPMYCEQSYTHLSELNKAFLQRICVYLGIKTKISDSADYEITAGKTEKLVNLCLQANASIYVSGPSAKDYIDIDVFIENKVELEWFSYDDYPEYPQLWGEFDHAVSMLDLLFNCGPEAVRYMRYVV